MTKQRCCGVDSKRAAAPYKVGRGAAVAHSYKGHSTCSASLSAKQHGRADSEKSRKVNFKTALTMYVNHFFEMYTTALYR